MTQRFVRASGLTCLMVFAMALMGAACGGDDAPADGSFIKSVTMTTEVKGDTFKPGEATTVFSPDDVIHAVVAIVKAPKDTVFQARWTVVAVGDAADPGQEIDVVDATAEGTRNINFDLKPTSKWPLGSYKVEISVDGEVKRTVEWSVK